jgi:dUTP pyrophosphatase
MPPVDIRNSLNIPFKRLDPNAVLPTYAKPGDSGMDLTAVDFQITDGFIEYRTGLAVEIPLGFEGQIRPRSSVSKKPLILANGPGTIDAGYRGEIRVRFRPIGDLSTSEVVEGILNDHLNGESESPFGYLPGERVAQLVVVEVPLIFPMWATDLTDTERGEGGFGSSGK